MAVRAHGQRRRHRACGQGPPEAKIRYIRGFSDPGDSFTGDPTYILLFSVPPGPKSNIQRARFFSLRAVWPFHYATAVSALMKQKG